MRSSLDGGSSSGGDQIAVSRSAGAMPSGSMTGDQCAVPATRPNGSALSGLLRLRTLPSTNSMSSGRTLSCLAAIAASRSRICLAGHMRRHRGARREAAGIGARRDRPRVLGGVDFQHDVDVVGLQAELVGDDLRQHGVVALPLHRDIGGHRHRAERIDIDRDHRNRAVLRPGLLARLGRSAGSRDSPCWTCRARPRRQSRCRNACRPARAASRRRLRSSSRPPPVAVVDRLRIIAGIVERAGRGPVGKLAPPARDCA